MPNSGIFYANGKFNISKLATDTTPFVGAVEGLGHHDGAGAKEPLSASLSNGEAFATSQQIVDYVTTSIGANSAYTLPAISDPGFSAFAFTALSQQLDTLPEVDRHQNRYVEIFDAISKGMEEAERLDSVERSRAMGIEASLQSELDAVELAAGLNADGTFAAHTSSNYLGAATSMKAVDAALDAQAKQNADDIASEASTRASQDTLIQNELDDTQTGAGLTNTGAYQADGSADYISGATSLADADSLLDDQAKANADAIAQEAQDRATADTLLRGDVDSALGTSVPNFSVTASGLATANGYNTAFNGASDVKTALEALDSAIFAMLDGSSVSLDNLKELVDAYEAMDSDVFAMVSGIFGFTGMVSTPSLNADGVANEVIAFSYSGTNYMDSASTLKAADILLDSAIKANADAIAAEETRAIGAEGALGLRIDSVNTAAGLVGDAYTANASANYIATAVSLKDADEKLDVALKAEETQRIADDATLQANIDAEEVARIASDGNLSFTYVDSNGQPASATDLTAAINELGAAVASSNTTVQAELDATQTALGMTAHASATAGNGGYYMPAVVAPAASGSYFKVGSDINAGSSLVAMFGSVQSDMQAMSEAFEQEDIDLGVRCDDLQTELDATQGGAGLASDGAYSANTGADFIQNASSLKDADDKLDAALKAEETARIADVDAEETRAMGVESAIQSELDLTQQSVLGANTTAYSPASANYISTQSMSANVDDLADALKAEETQRISDDSAIRSDAQTSLGRVLGSWSHAGTNYIDSASDIADALEILDGQVQANSVAQEDDLTIKIAGVANAVIDLDTEALDISGGDTATASGSANIRVEAASAGKGFEIDLEEHVEVVSVSADEYVRSAISASSIAVQHEPFVAASAMDSGDIVCIQKGGTVKYGIEKADIGSSSKIEILGMAFDPTSSTGGITAHAFAVADSVAIVKSGQNVEGVSFAAKDQSGAALVYAVGDALYLGKDDQGNDCITKSIPADDSSIGFDAKAVISLGFVSALNGTNGATANGMWFEVKLVAMEA